MNRANVEFARSLYHEIDALGRDAAIAEFGKNIKFVDEGFLAAIFKAEADRQNDVAGALAGILDKPNAAECWITDELLEYSATMGFVKGRGARVVVFQGAHHRQEDVGVLWRGVSQL